MLPEPPLPSKLQIEPVGRCNLKCPMCVAPYRDMASSPVGGRDALIALELLHDVVNSLPGLEEVHLQGIGEPLLHPRVIDLVRCVVEAGARVTTSSNLTLLDDRMAELCVASGLDTVHVSIDAASPEVYRRIRVGASLDQVVANVKRLVRARRRLGSQLPRLKLVMVLMRRNLHELPAVVSLAGQLGFDGVFVQRLSHRFLEPSLPPSLRPLNSFAARESLDDFDAERLEELLEVARLRAVASGLEIRLPRTRPYGPSVVGRERCDWPWTQAYICYDGSALPCCMVGVPERVCLSSTVENSLSEIWRGAAYQAFRQRLESEDPPEVCQSCALYRGVF